MTLLEQIQADAIDSNVDLSETLRRCKVLAARLKNREFTDWVTKELNGYESDDELPPYRESQTQSRGTFETAGRNPRDMPIPSDSLPAHLRHHVTDLLFRDSVGKLLEVQRNIKNGTAELPWDPNLIAHIQQNSAIYSGGWKLVAAHKVVSSTEVIGILETVRTRVLDFVLAIEAVNPAAGEASATEPPIPPERVTQIFYTTVTHGSQANIGTQGNATITIGAVTTYHGVPEDNRAEVQQLVTKLKQEIVDGEFEDEDREEASEALAKLETQLAKEKPDGGRMKHYLTLVATLITSVAPTVNALISVFQRLGLF